MSLTIGYLSMVNNYKYARQAVTNAFFQDYPNTNKGVYLIHDYDMEPVHSTLPVMPVHNIYLDEPVIDQRWWILKISRALTVMNEDIIVMWDSDDLYEPRYTDKIASFFVRYPDIQFAWNLEMIDVNMQGLSFKTFNSGIGTLAARAGAFKNEISKFSSKYRKGTFFSSKKKMDLPLDFPFREYLKKKYEVGDGNWIRAYFNHPECFSSLTNKDVRKDSIKA